MMQAYPELIQYAFAALIGLAVYPAAVLYFFLILAWWAVKSIFRDVFSITM